MATDLENLLTFLHQADITQHKPNTPLGEDTYKHLETDGKDTLIILNRGREGHLPLFVFNPEGKLKQYGLGQFTK